MDRERIAELSMAFHPATIPGLADEIWRLNLVIAEARKERDNLERIVLEHCIKTGETVQGENSPPCYAQDFVKDVRNGRPIWDWKLAFERPRKTSAE